MKSKSAKRLFSMSVLVLGLAMMLCLGLAPLAVAQSSAVPLRPTGVQGTWKVKIQLVMCGDSTPIGQPFYSLLTFAEGGTMTETTENPMFFPAVRGPGHGVWSSLGDDDYRANTIAFITLNGELVKTQTITQKIHMEEESDTWSSVAAVKFFDPAGNLLKSGCAVAVGVRFQ